MSWVETARLTVEKIKKKRVETEELVHGTDCERSELSESQKNYTEYSKEKD